MKWPNLDGLGRQCGLLTFLNDHSDYRAFEIDRVRQTIPGMFKLLREEEAKRRESLERNRQEAKADTLESLIELAKSRGYRYPEAWAKHRIAGRARKKAFTE